MVIASFIPSVSGMDAQSHALGQVSTNIANMGTIGYKSTDTMFYTLLGSQPVVKSSTVNMNSYARSDINGVGYYDRTNVDTQGQIKPTGNYFDVAINGTGNAFFTRAGNFGSRVEGGNTYLVGQNGMKVQGYPYLGNAGFGASYQDIIVDPLKKIPSVPSTKFDVSANVPASDVETSTYGLTVYGPNNDGRNVQMLFSKVEDMANTWDVTFVTPDGTVINDPQRVTFSEKGTGPQPSSLNLSVQWNEAAGGGGNDVSIDISKMTQYAGSSGVVDISQDGHPSGDLIKTYIDENGIIQSQYTNTQTIPVAKLAVMGFQAPNNLIAQSGTIFSATQAAGDMFAVNTDAKEKILQPQALEQSIVNVEQEFSKLILVQRAYSLNTSSFTANNEMLQTTVNLKS